ncbi:unnamed protein product [Nezara viridula]|uniref:Uncharacterized protein n=1 Tax=Nezara viridula TaxID=85310 RepID=A0A9P0E655_NEZVI|nr:unnamed protein product [Nezara viridula]
MKMLKKVILSTIAIAGAGTALWFLYKRSSSKEKEELGLEPQPPASEDEAQELVEQRNIAVQGETKPSVKRMAKIKSIKQLKRNLSFLMYWIGNHQDINKVLVTARADISKEATEFFTASYKKFGGEAEDISKNVEEDDELVPQIKFEVQQ